MKRRAFLAGATAAFAVAGMSARAAQGDLEKSRITLGVGGKPLLYYLPLTIAERRGYFRDRGLDVDINDFGGGAKSLQALVGGSVDVVTGAYEHTIRMQAKGQDVRAVAELGRFPGIVIAVRRDLAGAIRSIVDLKGRKIGVTAPGSSTALAMQYALVKAGLKPSDAAIIGIGGGASAVAAVKNGMVDAISHLDPVVVKLEADGDIVSLIDTRTESGTRELFGAPNPAATLYMKNDFITRYPVATQRLVDSFLEALRWIVSASPEAIADVVPSEYHLGDKALYVRAVAASKATYSRDGIVPAAGMESVLDMLRKLDPEFATTTIDLSRTYDGRFASRAG